jgi:hypothetical protein
MKKNNTTNEMPTEPAKILELIIKKLENGAVLMCLPTKNLVNDQKEGTIITVSNRILIELLKQVQLKQNVSTGEWKMQHRIIEAE